jgi:hypothetical protein
MEWIYTYDLLMVMMYVWHPNPVPAVNSVIHVEPFNTADGVRSNDTDEASDRDSVP